MTTEKDRLHHNVRMEMIEDGETTYQVYLDRLVGVSNTAQKVLISSSFPLTVSDSDTYSCSEMYIGEETYLLLETGEVYLPNCTELTLGEGYTDVTWSAARFHAPLVETIYLPSTLTSLLTTLSPDIAEVSEQAVKQAMIRYDADATTLFGDMPMGSWLTAEDFEQAQYRAARSGWFTMWDGLTHIYVSKDHRDLYDIDGVLYANASWRIEDLPMLYHPELNEMPVVRLMCIPQNHPASDGIYSVTEGTQYIHSGGIFYPKNIHTLILPDSLLYLSPTAIIATAEHPLTVVCSPGSAAAEYVEQFGEMYHLILQLTE